MNPMRLKLLAATILIVSAVGYLAMAGMSDGWVYYIDVDTLLSEEKYQQTRVRLCGRVSEEQFEAAPARLTATFLLLGPSQTLPVHYNGVISEQFKPGVEVVLEGRWDNATEQFVADTLMTKCASKYQAEEHAQRLEADHDR